MSNKMTDETHAGVISILAEEHLHHRLDVPHDISPKWEGSAWTAFIEFVEKATPPCVDAWIFAVALNGYSNLKSQAFKLPWKFHELEHGYRVLIDSSELRPGPVWLYVWDSYCNSHGYLCTLASS